MDTDSQILANGFSNLSELDHDVMINPFLQIPLENMALGQPRIESNFVFFSDVGSTVALTPMTQGIHLPYNIYSFMEENFFVWICSSVENFVSTDSEYLDISQSYLALSECQCKGQDYSGMPAIQLLFEA